MLRLATFQRKRLRPRFDLAYGLVSEQQGFPSGTSAAAESETSALTTAVIGSAHMLAIRLAAGGGSVTLTTLVTIGR